MGECSLFDGRYVDFRSTKHCSQANWLQWRLKTRSKTETYYMLVTRLIPGNTLLKIRYWHKWVKRSSMQMCQRRQSQRTSLQKPSAWWITELLEGGEKNTEVMEVGRSSQFLLSKRETGTQGISYSTHEEWTDTTGQQILTTRKKKKKGKHRERSKLHPFSPICSHIYIYIHMAMYIYICIYTETDPPPRTKRRGRR